MTENTPQYNQKIITWSQKLRLKLKSSISVLTQKGKGDLVASLRSRIKKNYGEIERVDFVFARHGVFFQKGTGRGYKVQEGKVIRNSSRESKVIIARKPKDWIKPVNDYINELIDIVANYQADNATEVIVKT